MATISFVVPCTAEWVEKIYQLEVTDRVAGYDPILGTDGPANRQALELGSRTLYLKKNLDWQHVVGHHELRMRDFDQEIKIPEEKLGLDYATQVLADNIQDMRDKAAETLELINRYTNIDISAAYMLSRLMPYCREYFNDGVDYELFNEGAMLRAFALTEITREISGDDSLDVISTEGIIEGQNYFIMDPDGGNIEEVTVLSVLTEHRIRFTTDLQITRAKGFLSATSLLPEQDHARVKYDFAYISDWIDTLERADSGLFYVHRDNVSVVGRVFYLAENSEEWVEAHYQGYKSFFDGSIDDVFRLPAKKLRVRVEYPLGEEGEWNVYYFAIKAEVYCTLPEQVRQPKITGMYLSGQRLTIHGDPFASLRDFTQKGMELRVSVKDEYMGEPLHFSVPGATSSMCVNIPGRMLDYRPLLAEIRYVDEEGVKSRWSRSWEVV